MEAKKHFPLVMTATLTLVLSLMSCTTFKGEIPFDASSSGDVYISPKNQDGIQDRFVLTADIPDIKGLKVAGYKILVTDETGRIVYSISGGKEIPQGKTKISGRKVPLKVPSEIVWEGKDDDGAWVSDGLYWMALSAWDYDGNKGALDPIGIVVDNTPPDAEISLPYKIFSPNGDGKQDVLDVYQKSSVEDEWSGAFLNSDNSRVYTYSRIGEAGDFQWNGQDSNGNALPDGEYSFQLSSRDRAGNSYSTSVPSIVIENRKFAITIDPDLNFFSPNRDGIKDSVVFTLGAQGTAQISDMSLTVINQKGETVRVLDTGDRTFPIKVSFDGRDKSSRFLPEGNYYGVLSAIYANGDSPVVTSGQIALDITPPQAVISRGFPVFSPDGDGKKDVLPLSQSTSIEDLWEGSITDSSGKVIKSYSWKDRAVAFDWDGKDSTGETVPDGRYLYTIKSTDMAGNTGNYSSREFIVDNRPTPVTVTPRTAVFSPNGDGFDDYVDFDLNPQVKDGIRQWNCSIVDSDNNVVYDFGTFEKPEIPETISWNGRNSSGQVAEGSFKASLTVEYDKGNLVSVNSDKPVILDIAGPVISVNLGGIPFSPDGDGTSDNLQIGVKLTDVSAIKNWNATILDPTGQPFFSIPSSSFKDGRYTWNGKSARGELVQSASDYTVVVNAEDVIGNASTSSTVLPIDILVIRDGDKLRISISSIYFKPFTADYLDVEPDLKAANLQTLDKLAVVLKKYSAYKIQMEGNAVRVYWDQPDKWLKEETEVLGPLSAQRAAAIRDALVLRGIAASRVSISGNGGYKPVVPHSDLINRWKNRRVEFILVK